MLFAFAVVHSEEEYRRLLRAWPQLRREHPSAVLHTLDWVDPLGQITYILSTNSEELALLLHPVGSPASPSWMTHSIAPEDSQALLDASSLAKDRNSDVLIDLERRLDRIREALRLNNEP